VPGITVDKILIFKETNSMRLKRMSLCSYGYLSLIVVLFSCSKADLQVQTIPGAESKLSGVTASDPVLTASVPVLMSEDFLQSSRLATLNGKSTNDFLKAKRSTDKTLPVVSITSPSNGATVSGTVSIKVSASDNVGVSSVTVYIDGALLGKISVAPYTFSWNSSSVAKATALDAAGNAGSVSIQVGVNSTASGDISAPAVSINSPANGSSFTIGDIVSIAAGASDNVGVSSVALYIDGTLNSTLTTAPYNFSWNTTGLASGTHTIGITAKDAAGNTSSASISVTLNTKVISGTNPSSFQLQMPSVLNQGNEGSCVSFSVGYYARSGEQFYKTGAASYSNSVNVFSPEFLFNQTKTSSDCSGSAVITALDFIKSKGICSFQSMPYSSTNGCALMPTSSQLTEAAGYKIVSYSAIYASDITGIKTMVAAKHPLVAPVSIDANFYNAGPGYIWNSFSGFYNNHVVTICGYDDAKHAFKAVNSWGTTWGDAGYIWIDYDFLSTVCYQVYVMSL
jgi:hypothetical protein